MADKVLVYSRFPKAMLKRIGEDFELLVCGAKSPAEAFSADELADVRAAICAGGGAFPVSDLDALPALKAIVCYGTGYDGIDLAELRKRGIALANSPAANAAAVADLALTLLLATTRRLLPSDNYLRSGDWANSKPSPWMATQPGLAGRKIGVYGMGEIGRKIASRIAAFETDVAYHSRSKHDVPYAYMPTLEALADWCDVLVIAVRANPDTDKLVNADILQRLGKSGHVVNISRGSVIDQAALITALQQNVIAGAGLDVFETEPYVPDALATFPNVVLTPHIGGHTQEAHVAMQDCVLANLRGCFNDGRVAYPVIG